MKLQNITYLNFQKQSGVIKQSNEIKNNFSNSYTSHTLNNDPKACLNKMNISFGKRISISPSLQKAIDEKDYEKILTHFEIEVEKDEEGMLTLSHYDQPDEDTTFADLGIDENEMFKHIRKITGNAYLENCKATSLGSITEIEGDAVFYHSAIESLGNLETIGQDADFQYSVVASLGKLKTIGNNAIFASSQITDLQNLESIGGDADFRDTQIESFGKLKEIMRHVYINSDDIEDKLKDILICGDVINDEMDYLED